MTGGKEEEESRAGGPEDSRRERDNEGKGEGQGQGKERQEIVDRLISWPVGKDEAGEAERQLGQGGGEAETRGLASPREAMACLTSCEGLGAPPATGSGTRARSARGVGGWRLAVGGCRVDPLISWPVGRRGSGR